MPLTPLDAEKHSFRPALRGYDKLEVEQFRAGVMQALEEYIDAIGRLRVRIGELEAEIGRYRETEDLLKSSVLLAQKTSEEIIAAAKAQAEALLAQAHADGQELRRRYSQVEADRERFEHQFHALLTGYLRQLEARNPGLLGALPPSQAHGSAAMAPSPPAAPPVTPPPPANAATGAVPEAPMPRDPPAAAQPAAAVEAAAPGVLANKRGSAFEAWQEPFSAEPHYERAAPPQYAQPPAPPTAAADTGERDSDIAEFTRAIEKA